MKLRFLHRGTDDRYYWESVQAIGPGESRHEQISCAVTWFWQAPVQPPPRPNGRPHLSECLQVAYPKEARKDPVLYRCTCEDWYPDPC